MLTFLRSLWREPRVADPPGLRWFDIAVPVVIIPMAAAEALLRDDVVWPVVSVVAAVIVALITTVRNRQPLLALLATLGLMATLDVAALIRGTTWDGVLSLAILLLLPYALGRWAAGWEIEVGVVAMAAYYTFVTFNEYVSVGDSIGGGIVFFFPAVFGIAIRYQRNAQRQAIEDIRGQERAVLARELHDTVAHHVSAIAIQAQAGRAVAATRPEAALEALAVVENEASRTLAEMRSMIGALRASDEVELAPQRGVADIARLAEGRTGSGRGQPEVSVEFDGDLDDLRPSVDAAVYRLAQESITNARRHARRASRILVRVVGGADSVRLTVADDGDVTAIGPISDGYGLVGMAERAKLLGGTFTAGPHAGEGWRVEATLPRTGVAT